MFSQVILPLLKSDLYEVIQSTFDGLLHTSLPVWLENRTALTVVMASKGYPGDYTKGVEITGKYPGTKGGIRVQQVTCVTAGLPPVLCSVPFTGHQMAFYKAIRNLEGIFNHVGCGFQISRITVFKELPSVSLPHKKT